MDFDTVKDFIVKNKDSEQVLELLKDILPAPSITAEQVQEFLLTDEGRKIVRTHPEADTRVSEAIKKHDEKMKPVIESEVKRLVASEMLKLNPEESPEMKRIREAEAKWEASEKARAKEKLERQLIDEAVKKSLDISPLLNSGYLPESLEQGLLVVNTLESLIKAREEKVRNDVLTSGQRPGSGQARKDKPDISKLTAEELVQLELKGELNALLTA